MVVLYCFSPEALAIAKRKPWLTDVVSRSQRIIDGFVQDADNTDMRQWTSAKIDSLNGVLTVTADDEVGKKAREQWNRAMKSAGGLNVDNRNFVYTTTDPSIVERVKARIAVGDGAMIDNCVRVHTGVCADLLRGEASCGPRRRRVIVVAAKRGGKKRKRMPPPSAHRL